MTNKVVVVTPPDNFSLQEGFRILCVDLTTEQSQIVSNSVKLLEFKENVIIYVWKKDMEFEWLVDKKQRSQLVLFNADSENLLITGYLAAQPLSHYFGNLKTLHKINSNIVYDKFQLINVLENLNKLFEKK